VGSKTAKAAKAANLFRHQGYGGLARFRHQDWEWWGIVPGDHAAFTREHGPRDKPKLGAQELEQIQSAHGQGRKPAWKQAPKIVR
jgi:hypothetical protein